ncbi:sigma-70 factor domain-containing protein, partial [Synechococcus sp. R55.2]
MSESLDLQDAVGRFLKTIGRYSLLTAEEELRLAHQVQRMVTLLEQRQPYESVEGWSRRLGIPLAELQQILRQGEAA